MSRTGAALALLVALVAAGVVGMHTLGHHGSGHAAHGGATDVVATAHADHGPASAGATPTDEAPAPADGLAAACLFLLAVGVLAALLGPVVRRRPRGWLPLPRAWAPRVVVRPRVVGARPPPVWEHSVVRC